MIKSEYSPVEENQDKKHELPPLATTHSPCFIVRSTRYDQPVLLVYASLTASLIFLKPELESVLRRHKSQFVSLLKNPIRNSSDAALVRKASSEGIKLNTGEGSTMTQRLPPQIVDEAFIISDMFELNEISSLQLLLQGTITI